MIDAQKAFAMIRAGEILFVDVKFTDLRGVWHHFTVSAHDFTEESVEKGFGFDGSSIRGYQEIFESDMLLIPDMETVFVDPFFDKTLSVICEAYDPMLGEYFSKDPRYTARKAEKYLQDSGIADISYWGPETEFFVFDSMEYGLSPYESYVSLLSQDVGDEDGDGYKILPKAGYYPAPPFDKLQVFRSEMVSILESLGIEVEVHHHEVATAGQCEVDLKYGPLVKTADKVMMYKYVARNLAKQYGMTVCFLPKPIYGDNGSGMHTHQSLFKAGKNMFFDPEGYAELSDMAKQYAAGLLSNIHSVLAITNPTVNSYRRLVPHFEAPTAVAFSARNRSAAIRIPMYFRNVVKAKRLEFRCPDPTCNPYLSFAAQLVSGIEGVKGKMDPSEKGFGPFDENIWEKSGVAQTPDNIFTTLDALKADRILVKSGVFTQEQIDSYIGVKRDEARQNLLYPTPADYHFYSDI